MAHRAHVVLPTLTVFETDAPPASSTRRAGPQAGAAGALWRHAPGPGQPRRPSAPDLSRPRPRQRSPAPGGDFSRADPGLSPRQTSPVADLWAWLGRQNAVFASLAGFGRAPGGGAPAPRRRPGGDFAPAVGAAPGAGPRITLELLLVDWTFGTEELASYSPHPSRQVEEPPRLLHASCATPAETGPGSRRPGDPAPPERVTWRVRAQSWRTPWRPGWWCSPGTGNWTGASSPRCRCI